MKEGRRSCYCRSDFTSNSLAHLRNRASRVDYVDRAEVGYVRVVRVVGVLREASCGSAASSSGSPREGPPFSLLECCLPEAVVAGSLVTQSWVAPQRSLLAIDDGVLDRVD
jgi:hypothetical protein